MKKARKNARRRRMKRLINVYIIITAAVWCMMADASAQGLKSGYFLDGYLYRHMLNPAWESERSYVSVPGIGNVGLTSRGNVGLGNFLYPTEGNRLTTFMNSSVGDDEFLRGLKDVNRVSADLGVSVFSAGFRKWGGFNTIDIGLKSRSTAFVPKEMFEFMKRGQEGESTIYDIGETGLSSSNYLEVAIGHSRLWDDKLRIGAKLKLLMGIGHASMKIKDARVIMGESKWEVSATGSMNIAMSGLEIPTKEETGRDLESPEEGTVVDMENIRYDSPGLSGLGMAVDVGAAYSATEHFTISAAITDVGFMNWTNNTYASTDEGTWTFDGFHEISIENGNENSMGEQINSLTDEISDYASLHRRSTGGRLGRILAATLNIGAEYALPVYDRLSLGFLSSTRINGRYSWSEGRLSANISPLGWLEAGVNYSISSFGSSMGAIVNFHPKGLGLFVGMDYLIGKVNPQFIPINNMNASICMGVNVTF